MILHEEHICTSSAEVSGNQPTGDEQMVRLKIIDLKGNTVEPEELTDVGVGQIIFECDSLKATLEELHAKMNEDED
jgi:hypothetical protein